MLLPPECSFVHDWQKPCPWVRACLTCGKTQENYSYSAMNSWQNCSFEDYKEGIKKYEEMVSKKRQSRVKTLVHLRKEGRR
jgi:hypothetical protein